MPIRVGLSIHGATSRKGKPKEGVIVARYIRTDRADSGSLHVPAKCHCKSTVFYHVIPRCQSWSPSQSGTVLIIFLSSKSCSRAGMVMRRELLRKQSGIAIKGNYFSLSTQWSSRKRSCDYLRKR